jgi:hypothetical protein
MYRVRQKNLTIFKSRYIGKPSRFSAAPCSFRIFTVTTIIVILIVMWDPTGKNKTEALRLTCRYFILAIYLVQRPDDGLVNYSETCGLYVRNKTRICCV